MFIRDQGLCGQNCTESLHGDAYSLLTLFIFSLFHSFSLIINERSRSDTFFKIVPFLNFLRGSGI